MRSKLSVGVIAAMLISVAAATPAMALFAPHGAKGLKSTVENTTIILEGSSIKCPSAKATEGEINGTGTESNIGKISWNECSASGLGAEVTCNHPVLIQPNKEGTTEGKFTLTLNENCTVKIASGGCVITIPSETAKKKEKGIQAFKEGFEISKFTNEKELAMTAKGSVCAISGIKEGKDVATKFEFLLKQEGVTLE